MTKTLFHLVMMLSLALCISCAKDDMVASPNYVSDNNYFNDGDIEIIFTGLRPGEKLYEELLIGENVTTTKHEKIMRATEEDYAWEDLKQHLAELKHAVEIDDYEKIREIFIKTVFGYNPQGEIIEPSFLRRK